MLPTIPYPFSAATNARVGDVARGAAFPGPEFVVVDAFVVAEDDTDTVLPVPVVVAACGDLGGCISETSGGAKSLPGPDVSGPSNPSLLPFAVI